MHRKQFSDKGKRCQSRSESPVTFGVITISACRKFSPLDREKIQREFIERRQSEMRMRYLAHIGKERKNEGLSERASNSVWAKHRLTSRESL